MSRGRGNTRMRTADEAWPDGYMAAKIQKLEMQFQADSKQFEQKSDIFKGVAIHVNGYTQPSSDELRRLIGIHGGHYLNYFQRGANHYVICCNLSKAKKADWLKYAVRPAWIVDSINIGHRLPVADYYLEKKRTVFDIQTEVPSTSTDKVNCPTISDLVIGKDTSLELAELKAEAAKKEEPRTASDAGFVEKFFKKSRLSFIATMKVKMQGYLKTLKENPDHEFTGKSFLTRDSQHEEVSDSPVFLHIDMDCFFASVAVRNRPELRDKPVAICSNQKAKRKNQDPNLDLTDYRSWNWQDASTAEISCVNYAARQFGISASMFLGMAQALCPDLIVLPYDFEGFEEVSRCLYDSVASLTLNIEAQSVDELYADVTDVIRETQCTPEAIGRYLKQTILEASGCACTVGMGPNLLIARLATKKVKPDGLCYIRQEEVADFMADKKVSEIPGVGGSTEEKLREIGVITCQQLQKVKLSDLKELFGANQAVKIVELARGVCTRKIKDAIDVQRKNISVEINYGMRFKETSEVKNCLEELSAEVHKRLLHANSAAEMLRFRILVRRPDAPEETMKYLGCGRCNAMALSESFKVPMSCKDAISKCVWSLFEKLNPPVKDIRGMGITLSKFTSLKNVPKITKLDAFLDKTARSEVPAAQIKEDEIVPVAPSEVTPKVEDLEIYILSSEDDSEEIIILEPDDPPPVSKDIPKKALQPAKQGKKLKGKRMSQQSKKTSTKGQLDIRRVLEFGKELRGEIIVPVKENRASTSTAVESSPQKPSIAKAERISFGPKKLFHMNKLLREWLESSKAPFDEDVSAWLEALRKVVLVDPRSCTILLRTLIRLAPVGWSETCVRIREKLQEFVDIKIQAGELTVSL